MQVRALNTADLEPLGATPLTDAQRLQNPASSLNRLVYDSHEPIDLRESPFASETSLNKIFPPPAEGDPRAVPPRRGNLATRAEPTSLAFESRFESGNLRRALQVPSTERFLIHPIAGRLVTGRL